ncbi:MAG: hypothetical protein ACXAC5_13375 [Promethearchaeota archaeon]|jgi:hypothetical protein
MSEEWKHAGWVSIVGMLAWIVGILSGVVNIILGLVGIGTLGIAPFGLGAAFMAPFIWQIISGSIAILISLFIILPKFSLKCSKKDWDSLLNWVWKLGNIRLPWMLVWGVLVGIFGWGYGGVLIIVPALVLIFAYPTKYEWKTK